MTQYGVLREDEKRIFALVPRPSAAEAADSSPHPNEAALPKAAEPAFGSSASSSFHSEETELQSATQSELDASTSSSFHSEETELQGATLSLDSSYSSSFRLGETEPQSATQTGAARDSYNFNTPSSPREESLIQGVKGLSFHI